MDRLKRGKTRTGSFDDDFYESLIHAANVTVGEHATKQQFIEAVINAAGPKLETLTSQVVAHLQKQTSRMLREHRRYEHGFEGRLRKFWGDALDQLYAITVCAEESGRDFNDSHRSAAVAKNDLLFEALSGLHARACRTSFEVHRLLCSGFPTGALARCRTLHELAVTSAVLSQYGRKPESSDLAERYILHDYVLNYKDALDYQAHCETLGYEPFSDGELADLKAGKDDVVKRFGKSFAGANGWAAELTGAEQPGFIDLERIADLSHLRGYYKWASHEVHADSKGWRLNRGERGNVTYMSTGHVNFGLSEPGQLAIGSLHLSLIYFLTSVDSISPQNLVSIMAVQALADQAVKSFADAEDEVHQAENLIQQKMN